MDKLPVSSASAVGLGAVCALVATMAAVVAVDGGWVGW